MEIRTILIIAAFYGCHCTYALKFSNVMGGIRIPGLSWKRNSPSVGNLTSSERQSPTVTQVAPGYIFPGRCLEFDFCIDGGAILENGLSPCKDIVDGTHTCECPTGYNLYSDGVCKSPTICDAAEKGGLFCPLGPGNPACIVDTTYPEGFRCDCPVGTFYSYPFAECVTDPCIDNPCMTGGTCTNQQADRTTDGYPFKCTCTAPKVFNAGTCEDPCDGKEGPTCTVCKQDETERRGYYCTCPAGWLFDRNGDGICVDPCADAQFDGTKNCQKNDPGSKCVPTKQSTVLYTCACSSNFIVAATTTEHVCKVNPCYTADTVDSNPCNNYADSGATCVASADGASYQCKCSTGFDYTSGTCRDKDECSSKNACGDVDGKSTCTNTVGSFSCSCSNGYIKTSSGLCADIDECSTTRDICRANGDKQSQCQNYNGGYTCLCSSAFNFYDGTCTKLGSIKATNAASSILRGLRTFLALPFILFSYVMYFLFTLVTFPVRFLSRPSANAVVTKRLSPNIDIVDFLTRFGKTVDLSHLE